MSDLPKQNPPTNVILAKHELAHRTITQHNTELGIFDQSELAMLKRFVLNPTAETQRRILEEDLGVQVQPEGTPEDEIGVIRPETYSLAGYVIARYGRVTEHKNTLLPTEIEMLREWFEGGGGQTAAKL